jgi:ribosome biogenesis GTPase
MKEEKGIVVKSTGSWYNVLISDGRTIPCRIQGRFKIQGFKSTNPVAVGDYVDIEINESEETGIIYHLHERKNYIIRKSTNLSRQHHIIASNIDFAGLIITLKSPVTHAEFIDRFLITAEAFNIPPLIIINKADIYSEQEKPEVDRLMQIYRDVGYKSVFVSAKDGMNMDELTGILSGKTTLLSGNSGVGKSSIINYIQPGIELKTNEISDLHKAGKHTTTFAEMFFLSHDIRVIDTPGIRGFGLIEIGKEELYHYFPEIFKYAGNCKFHNCVHVHEPGCYVREMVQEGEISEQRYLNYLNIYFDEERKYR